MHVEVGPVPSASALAFADFAEDVLAVRGEELPEDVRTAFRGYVAEWRAAGATSTTLTWQTEAPLEVGEYLVHAFYRLAQRIDAARPDDTPIVPLDASPFYQALVRALLAGMDDAGAGSAEFADHLRGFWPGREDS